MLSSLLRSRSTRRTATVTISAPDASIARTISAVAPVFAGADHEPGAEAAPAEDERGVVEGVGADGFRAQRAGHDDSKEYRTER